MKRRCGLRAVNRFVIIHSLINIANIEQFFESRVWDKSSGQVSGRNFVGKRWISDSDMDTKFDIAN